MVLPIKHPQYGGLLTYYNDLEVGTEFYVANGAWEGKIIMEDGIKKVFVYDTGKSFLIEEGRCDWLSEGSIVNRDNLDNLKEKLKEESKNVNISKYCLSYTDINGITSSVSLPLLLTEDLTDFFTALGYNLKAK